MKLMLEKSKSKTVVNIDPIHSPKDRRFNPMIAVVVFHLPEAFGDGSPKVITGYAGHMSSMDAGLYSESLMVASFMASRVTEGQTLESVFQQMETERETVLTRRVSNHGKQYQSEGVFI